jgi:hypothetical protein
MDMKLDGRLHFFAESVGDGGAPPFELTGGLGHKNGVVVIKKIKITNGTLTHPCQTIVLLFVLYDSTQVFH